ncbi:MAG: hypothetical protein MUC89_01460 [Acetobacteraceae bacterium]|jgi:hypothetical protein|nr:hypothetical protein [Acetobacteraceae bacterium]
MSQAIRVDRIEVLAERRIPTAIVWARLGEAVLGFTLRHKRRGAFVLAPPEAADRSHGVRLPPALASALRAEVEAALAGDPETHAKLARYWTPAPKKVRSG